MPVAKQASRAASQSLSDLLIREWTLLDHLLIALLSLYRIVLKLYIKTATQIGPDLLKARGTPAPANKKCSSK